MEDTKTPVENELQEITIEELQEAAMPLVQLIREKGNPHTTAIVTGVSAEIMLGFSWYTVTLRRLIITTNN